MKIRLIEGALVAAMLLAMGALWFKNHTYRSVETETKRLEREIGEISLAASLKELWKSPEVKMSLTKLRQAGGGAKNWQKEGKKIIATYSSIDIKAVDAVITRVMRTPVMIDRIEVKRNAQRYDVELTCKLL